MGLVERDLRHVWHPASQMSDYATFAPIEIVGAQGSYLMDAKGNRIIDAVSSWWCKSLGHKHPRLTAALIQQAERYEHVIGANTCIEPVVKLAEKLAQLSPGCQKVFFACDGSSAVEIALKMSVHAQQRRGEFDKTQFIALENAYHGETIATLSVSDCDIFKKPYESLLSPTYFIQNIPYVHSIDDPLWNDCSSVWPAIEANLESRATHCAAIIVEPIVQGAGGMQLYSADFLKRLSQFAKKHGIFLIADEIMTGFGRTSTALASYHANVQPDFICLGKGLTAGYLPMSAVLIHDKIYELFYGDYGPQTSFFHSHTHTGNALAAAVACAALDEYAETNCYATVEENADFLRTLMEQVGSTTGAIKNIRSIGAIVAADLINPDNLPRYGYQVFQRAIKLGAWLRPIGNAIYWLPPLNTSRETLERLAEITAEAIG